MVRNGEDFWLYGGHHTLWNVFREMFFQVVTDFNVGDFRKLTFDEVEMFYEAGRDALKAATKPTKG